MIQHATFTTGIALNRSQSEYPHLWDGLVGIWSPELGKQGSTLYDFSHQNHHGALTNMDPSTDYVPGIHGYALNYDGTNDFVNMGNIPEINDASQDISFVYWMRAGTQSTTAMFMYDENDSLSPSIDMYCMFKTNFTIGGVGDASEWNTGYASSNIQDNKWHLVVIVLDGGNEYLYIDSQLVASRAVAHNHANYGTSHNLKLADNANVGHYSGDMGSFSVYNRALMPTEVSEIYSGASPLMLSPNIAYPRAPFAPLTALIDETVLLNDTWQVQTNPAIEDIDETVVLDDTWQVQTNPSLIDIDETVILDDVWSILTVQKADFISKIIFTNPLVFVTDTNPAKIFKVDITDPTDPITTGTELVGVQGARSVSYNATTGFLYVACENGKVVKVDFTDLTIQTIIDLTDTDNLETIDNFDTDYITFISTDSSLGELHMLDEREVSSLNTDFQFLQENIDQIETELNWIESSSLDTNFQFLEVVEGQMNTDFKWSPEPASITPIARTDFDVKINGTSLTGDDLVLDSITITHTEAEEDSATFRVARKHDNMNNTLNGVSSIITSQNAVQIFIKGNEEFSGNVSNINCVFETNQEFVSISALGEQQTESKKKITMSLPSNTSQVGLYEVLIQNPVIDNPIIDPNDENPKFFKGIKVNLGTKITQVISQYRFLGDTAALARNITGGSYKPKQNQSYFWFGGARNFLTGEFFSFESESASLEYLGTSIGTLAGDTWEISNLSYRKQRQFEDLEEDLGEYTVGEAPFNEISTRNGILIPENKWVDKPDGLYRNKDAGYNFEDFAKRVADLEFEKIKTINGVVSPKTSASMTLSIDGYYFYAIKLSTRININNTTQDNIFKNNNGFPVSVKAITISSESMSISLSTDNLKSFLELQEIDDQLPDEDSDEFNSPAESVRNFKKFDPDTGRDIE